jgi:hypothetical protein
MSREARYRNKPFSLPGGSCYSQFSAENGPSLVDNSGGTSLYLSDMHDYVGFPVEESPLALVKAQSIQLVGIDGGFGTITDDQFANSQGFIPGRLQQILSWTPEDVPEIPSSADSATSMYARTNPSRPFVNPGSLIQDLVTLPKMIFDIGSHLRDPVTNKLSDLDLNRVANAGLAGKFGWVPLFKDITDLLQVANKVKQRFKELKTLQESGEIRRRVKLGSWSYHDDYHVTVDSGFPLAYDAKVVVNTTIERWGVVKWKLYDFDFQNLTDTQLLDKATTIVHGGNASGAFASSWDVIPWTWLLGWFTNVRDFVIATGNSVPVYPQQHALVMTHTVQSRIVSDATFTHSEFTGGIGSTVWERKIREIFNSPSIQANLPLITGDQLSTLSLLGVQRLR